MGLAVNEELITNWSKNKDNYAFTQVKKKQGGKVEQGKDDGVVMSITS